MYTGFDPRYKAFTSQAFVAVGGETLLPFTAAFESLIFKNGSLLLYGVNYTINQVTGAVTLLAAASASDKFTVINLSSFTGSAHAGGVNLKVTGTKGIGNVLTATLTGAEATGFQWYRNGAAIAGATDIRSINYLLCTEDLTNAVWVKTSTTITGAYAVAPDGTTTGNRVQQASGSSTVVQTALFDSIVGDTFTISIFAKTATPVLSLSAGSITGSTTSTVLDVGGGWYRQWLVLTASEVATNKIIGLQIQGPQDIVVWGAQIVKGSDPQPYSKVVASSTSGTRSQYTQVDADVGTGTVITVKATGLNSAVSYK